MQGYISRKLAAATIILGTAAGFYITKNFGQIALEDMAAKVQIADKIKTEVETSSQDKNWDAYTALYRAGITTPRQFTEHRVKEAKLFGIFSAHDTPTPLSALEDQLYHSYNELFSDGTRGAKEGELAGYHQAMQEILKKMYSRFTNKDSVSYGDFLNGRGFNPRMPNEADVDYINRHFDPGGIDLTQYDRGEGACPLQRQR